RPLRILRVEGGLRVHDRCGEASAYRRVAAWGVIPGMRGTTAGFGSIEVLVRALLDEFPELDARRVRAAVERAAAKGADPALDTEGDRFVDHRLARVEASEDSIERARILRELATSLADRRDAERALVVRLAAFGEAGEPDDVDALLRLAGITQRWG